MPCHIVSCAVGCVCVGSNLLKVKKRHDASVPQNPRHHSPVPCGDGSMSVMCSRTSVSVSRWQSAGAENQRCRTALRVFGFSCCPQDFPSQFFYRGDKSASMERILLRLFAGNSRILRRKSHKLNIWNGTRRLRLLSMETPI